MPVDLCFHFQVILREREIKRLKKEAEKTKGEEERPAFEETCPESQTEPCENSSQLSLMDENEGKAT